MKGASAAPPSPRAPEDMPDRVFPFLWFMFKSLPVYLRVSAVAICSMTAIVVSFNIYMMYGFKLLVDGLQTASAADPWATLGKPFWIVAMCCAVHTVLYRVRSLIDAYSIPETHNHIREMLMTYLLRHSHDYFHNRFSGELVNKIGNVNRGYHNLLWDRLQHGFIPPFFAIGMASYLLWSVDVKLVFLMWSIVAGLVISAIIFGPWVSRASGRVADREADITGQLVDTVSNVASVKNFAQGGHEITLLQRVQRPYIRDYRKLGWAQIIFWGAFDIIITGLVLGFIWQLVDNWSTGSMTLGDVTMCVAISWDLWWRLGGMSWTMTELAGDIGRMQEALDEILPPHEITDAPGAAPLTVTDGEIRFENVDFTHKSGHKVFDGFNLVIKPAEKVGLVGLSGAGKTTLCQLLLRNYEIQNGKILIDGQDIAEVTQESLRREIAVIPQEPSLFHRSLHENILYGNPEAGAARIESAADAAQAGEFIGTLPQGYETLVGERGVKLSGGQRQRIAVARAILKDAPILLLDEATSSLDSKTERRIQSALMAAMSGRTTLVIAHRLSTLVHLDRLIVLENGKITEEGTLDDLLELGGHFAELWQYQANGFLPNNL